MLEKGACEDQGSRDEGEREAKKYSQVEVENLYNTNSHWLGGDAESFESKGNRFQLETSNTCNCCWRRNAKSDSTRSLT